MVVLPELFGLTPHVLDVCDRLAERGLEVVCPDLFHRTPGAAVLPETDAGRDAGFAALSSLTADDLLSDIRAAASLLARPASDCGLVGLSVGGYVGFLAATRIPFARVALAYPGWLSSTQPPIAHDRAPLDDLADLAGEVLIVVGGDDRLIPADQQALLSQRLAGHRAGHEVLVLPGIGHGFLSPARASYDEAAAHLAWERIAGHVAA